MPKKAGRPPGTTTKVMAERVELTAKLLARRLTKGDIKRVLKKQYDIGPSVAEIYIRRAKDLLVEWSDKTREEHRNESYLFYNSVIQGDTAVEARITAQARIDKLLGLEAPAETTSRVTMDGSLKWEDLYGRDDGPDPVEQAIEEAGRKEMDR